VALAGTTSPLQASEFELEAARNAAVAARLEADQLDRMLIYGRRMLRFIGPQINLRANSEGSCAANRAGLGDGR
jgi:hypothetical protein